MSRIFLIGWLGTVFFLARAIVDPCVVKAEPFVPGFDRFHDPKFSTQNAANSNPLNSQLGELLLTDLSCVACHRTDEATAGKDAPRLAGILNRYSRSWVKGFLAAPQKVKPWSTMPDLLGQLPSSERPQVVDALLAYLQDDVLIEPTIKASGAQPVANEFWNKGNSDRGKSLFHQVGCVACHAADESLDAKGTQSDLEKRIASLDLDPEDLEEMGIVLPKPVNPVPMSQVAEKYSSRSLTMFLLEPHLIRPSGRMPSLKLKPDEAADVAAYLIKRTAKSGPPEKRSVMPLTDEVINVELAEQGRMWFEKLGCAICHAGDRSLAKAENESSELAKSASLNAREEASNSRETVLEQSMFKSAKPLDKLSIPKGPSGCLSATHNGPRYDLNAVQVQYIQQAIAERSKRREVSPDQELEYLLLRYNCYACHERGGHGGVGLKQARFFENKLQVDFGDEGRLPPPLDHVGFKLDSDWLKAVLNGKGDVRPHFLARMPIFARPARELAKLFNEVDTNRDAVASHKTVEGTKNSPQPKESDPLSKDSIVTKKSGESTFSLADGRMLLDSGCVQCHSFRGESLPGTIGIDLSQLDQRINNDWFQVFLRNPSAWKKNTRMPNFFPDGRSSVPTILDGDIDRQIDAIWAYVNSKDPTLPRKLVDNQSAFFELKPTDKPIVLRTFMESNSAGNYAIAVGLPEKVNFAFDAEKMRLAEAWKGAFLNAQGTWFDRFSPPAIPLGDHRVLFPTSTWVEVKDSKSLGSIGPAKLRFLGYRLNENRLPIFRYEVAGALIHESISFDIATQRLLRHIDVLSQSSDQAIRSLGFVVTEARVPTDAKLKVSVQSNTLDAEIRLNSMPIDQSSLTRINGSFVAPIDSTTKTIDVSYTW